MAILNDTVYVQFAFKNTSGEICVNGIPVWSVPEDLGATDQTIPINGFMVAGSNQVDMVLDIEGTPSTCRTPRKAKPKAGAWARMRVIKMPAGRGAQAPSPSTGSLLLEREWNGDKEQSEDVPRFVSGMFDSPGFGRWSYLGSKKLDLNVQTIEEVRVVAEAIRSALRAGDTRALLQIIEINFKELGQSVGATDDSADVAQLEAWIQQFKSHPDRVLPLDPSRWDFRIVGSGQLLMALNKDWSHIIQMKQPATDQHGNKVGDAIIRYPIILARIGDALRVVR